MQNVNNKQQYFYTVDFLRGLGALVILIWHYHHFYFTQPYFVYTGNNPIWNFEVQPFYDLFALFYHEGAWAVQFFWMLSGFVFANVYLKSEVSFKNFFINRFARLYPLHFITLISITIFQLINLEFIGHYQIVGNIDLFHFMLHLFFASNWGLESAGTYSYNSVIWSVSLEILVYGIFFIVLSNLKKYPIVLSILLTVTSFILQFKYGLFQCSFYFFSGVIVYLIVTRIQTKNILIISLALIFLSFFLLRTHVELIHYIFLNILIENKILVLSGLTLKGISALLMGGGIMIAAYFDISQKLNNFNNIFSWIGNNTYSTYLWHLPLQVLILFICDYFFVDRTFFNNKIVFIIWIIFMMIIGRLSFIYLENPAKLFIKDKFK